MELMWFSQDTWFLAAQETSFAWLIGRRLEKLRASIRAMRRTAFVILAACGGQAAAPRPPEPPPAAAGYPATRFVPAQPTYVLAAASMRDFQRTASGMLDSLGAAQETSQLLSRLLAVDPLSPDQTGAMGVDPDGGVAMFSEDLEPTIVVHLSSPDATHTFFDQQRDRGMRARSQIVDGTEVSTAHIGAGLDVSWAIDHDWMWVHFGSAGHGDDVTWFQHSHHPGAQTWALDWGFASKLGEQLKAKAGRVLGFIDPRALIDRLGKRAGGALACVNVARAIEHVGLALDGDTDHVDVKVAFDVGADHAAAIQRAVLPPPPGWEAAFHAAPVALELNLDLDAFIDFIQPCADAADVNLRDAHRDGVRALRLGVVSVDPDATWGTGAISAELHDRGVVTKLLDQIPMRSHFESDRAFGAFHGHRIKIPFKGTIDYVIDDHLTAIAVGEGVLDQLVAGVPTAAPPAMALDLRPAAMPAANWKWLLEMANAPGAAGFLDHLSTWRDAHIGLTVQADSLVLELSGNRK
jgi:hypothetical protein